MSSAPRQRECRLVQCLEPIAASQPFEEHALGVCRRELGGTGAGEIGTFRVGRINFERSTVEVGESLSDIADRLGFGPIKTYARRHVPVLGFIRDEVADV